jgi:peroxiredoxin
MMRLFSLFLILTLTSVAYARRNPGPKAGVWRFELKYPNVAVPFLMELEPAKKGWHATLINGKERLELDTIVVSKGKWIVPLQTYQNYLEFSALSPTMIRGHFVKPNKKPEERIPLEGRPGSFRRFELNAPKATVNLSGKWAMEITEADGSKTEAILLLDQSGNSLQASILTLTGDYRYIDGYVSESNFETGAFDGVFNFVFKGKLEGKLLSGVIASKTTSKFTAKRDDKVTLPDPLKQTQVESIDFSFPNMDGKTVSLSDYKGKPVIIQIFGSWCPNCIDELGFLGPWYEKNKSLGVEIIALSFERALSPEDALKHLRKVVKKRGIPYPVLLAGTSGADTPATKLPGIKNFISFPTTIFLNKNHQVHKVHAGFNGPGTGLYYDEFRTMFEKTILELRP